MSKLLILLFLVSACDESGKARRIYAGAEKFCEYKGGISQLHSGILVCKNGEMISQDFLER